MDDGLAALPSGILVEDPQGQPLGQGLDHRLKEVGVEFDRAQPQGIGDTAQALRIEERSIEFMQQALPQAVEPPRWHRLGDQILNPSLTSQIIIPLR
jgi:hypothetical protein